MGSKITKQSRSTGVSADYINSTLDDIEDDICQVDLLIARSTNIKTVKAYLKLRYLLEDTREYLRI